MTACNKHQNADMNTTTVTSATSSTMIVNTEALTSMIHSQKIVHTTTSRDTFHPAESKSQTVSYKNTSTTPQGNSTQS